VSQALPRSIALVFVALAACGHDGSYLRAAIDRASTELECGADVVTAREIGGGGIVVSGCGRQRSYTCLANRHRVVCAPDGAITTVSAATPSPPSATPPTSIELLDMALVRIALFACPVPPAPVALTVVVNASAQVERIDAPDLAAPTRTCVETAIRAQPFEPRHALVRSQMTWGSQDDRDVATARGGIGSCRPLSPVLIHVGVARSGAVSRIELEPTSEPAATCVSEALRGVTFEAASAARVFDLNVLPGDALTESAAR
jgi:hypothetical protein